MTVLEGKTAYPYITEFKKEPFKSFIFLEKNEIGKYYLTSYNDVVKYYQYFNQNLFDDPNLNLENIYWFLLFRKYLGEDREVNRDQIYNFIKNCSVSLNNKLGFKFSPNSTQLPDLWSTYFALASLKILGLLNEYLIHQGTDTLIKEILNFILSHKKGNLFLHCQNKDCDIDKKTSDVRTLYFVIETFTLLGYDIRSNRDKFSSYFNNLKKDSSLVFKLLCLKYLDLEYEVNEKLIEYLLQFQKENGGFSFKKVNGKINTSFWLVYALDNYNWLLEYNSMGIYSFLNKTINEILSSSSNLNLIKLMELSKAIILLSIIFNKFIEEIERVIFRQLEQEKYVNLKFIINVFGLTYGIEEVISFINLHYNFKLRIIDNKIEFNNFVRNLSSGEKTIISEIYEQLQTTNVISLKDIHKRYKDSYGKDFLKLKEDIFPLIEQMIQRNFFKGKIIKKRFNKYYFYLDFLLAKIIISDTEINFAQILYEKEKLKDIKNDIWNMTLKLKNTTSQIQEEIESYLIIDEVEYAKERLKFVLRNALMDADFLNENIENSFNLDLYYIDLQNVLKSEINEWDKLYSILKRRLSEVDSYLKEKITEKETLRKLNKLLDQVEEKIFIFNDSINRKFDDFKNSLRDFNEKKFTEEGFTEILLSFNVLKANIDEFDKKIYEIFKNITSNDNFIVQKRNAVAKTWVGIQDEFNEAFNYYTKGFNFFKDHLNKLNLLENQIKEKINIIKNQAQEKINKNLFQEAFNLIKKDSDLLNNEFSKETNDFQDTIKAELKKGQKLYLLYRSLLLLSEKVEENVINSIANNIQLLKEKVTEERNKAEIEDFDIFVSKEITKYKNDLTNYRNNLENIHNKSIKYIVREFDNFLNKYNTSYNQYLKKLNNLKQVITDFDESNFTVIQWNNFHEYFNQEVKILQEEYINKIIKEKIYGFIDERQTNDVNIMDLKKVLDLKCKVLIDKIKDLIEISEINGKLFEEEKKLLIFTEDYYKNRELRNFIENKLIKINQESIGKVLALYDSSIRNRTLNINMLEIVNRINDLNNFEEMINKEFTKKCKELQIQIESRVEYRQTKTYLESIVKNNRTALNNISNKLDFFNHILNLIDQIFNDLESELKINFQKYVDHTEKNEEKSYIKFKENVDEKWKALGEKLKNGMEKIEIELKVKSQTNEDSVKLFPELRELSVKKKNFYLKQLKEKKEKIIDKVIILKDEVLREQLINYINDQKIYIGQLLGTLQEKLDDDIEIKDFKSASHKIQKRAIDIQNEISILNKKVKNLVKGFNKQSSNFESKCRYILDDFNNFLTEYYAILTEKVKSSEQSIIKAYIKMAIKAVSNEYLTISFLNNELKIKRSDIQDHLIYLISADKLPGKYDPRLGVYYENPEIFQNLNEEELEVIKKLNFKVYMTLTRLKNFTSQFGSIIAFFASIMTITYYIFIFSGGNPTVFILPIGFILLIFFYFVFMKREKKKIKI